MDRRRLIAALLAAGAAPSLAAPGLAWADDLNPPLSKAFPYLDAYLALPPAERSRFYIAYRAVRDMRPAPDARGEIVNAAGQRTPLALGPGAMVTRLPSLAEIKAGGHLQIDGAPFRIGLELRSAIAPSTHVAAADIVLGLAQVNAAIAKISGPLSMVLPKLTAAYFPDAGQGRAEMGNGRGWALPVFNAPILGPVAYFEPAALPAAQAVLLTKAPSRILLGGHPKGA